MPLNGGNALLAKVNKNSGAHQKNFKEDRPISFLGKCRPLHLFAINIKCMQICVGVSSEKVHLQPIPAPINPKCTCFHFLLTFRLWPDARRLCARLCARPAQGLCSVQCAINSKHTSLLVTIRDGWISVFFAKLIRYRYDINLVSVYS